MKDFENISFKNNGKLKLLIIIGTRPEIIRLSAVITKCRKYFDCILAHTGQNYDYNLNGVFFHDLKLDDPDVYMDAVGDDLGATIGNIINYSYKLMQKIKPDALLILGDTNSCLSAIPAKRLHIPIFHMEAGNRCKDECLPEETNRRIVDIISDVNMAYSEHARRYLAECGLPKERTYVTGSPMAEVLRANLAEIEKSNVLEKLDVQSGKYILLSAHREENIDTEKNFLSLFMPLHFRVKKIEGCKKNAGRKNEGLSRCSDLRSEINNISCFCSCGQPRTSCGASRWGFRSTLSYAPQPERQPSHSFS